MIKKTTGETSIQTVYGATSHTPGNGDAAAALTFSHGHWAVENGYRYILDWNRNRGEDRRTLCTGHGPENITALRRFPGCVIRSKSRDTVAAAIQRMARNDRLVFGYLRMTDNSRYRPPALQARAR